MFKKSLTVFIYSALVILLCSCQSENQSTKIIAPFGSPSYAALYLDRDNYVVDIVQGADPLVAAFGSNQYDAIIAPTNLGAKFYNSAANYQLAASLVWGNYYLMSDHEFTIESLNGKTIYAFGENQTPDIVLKGVIEAQDINCSIAYVASIAEITSSFLLEPERIYMIAEPTLTTLIETHPKIHTLDLQSLYSSSSYPQASLFVKASLSDEAIQMLKDDIALSIQQINSESQISITKNMLESDLETDLLYASIVRSNLSYIDSSDARNDIEAYLNLIITYNEKLLATLPNQQFYR